MNKIILCFYLAISIVVTSGVTNAMGLIGYEDGPGMIENYKDHKNGIETYSIADRQYKKYSRAAALRWIANVKEMRRKIRNGAVAIGTAALGCSYFPVPIVNGIFRAATGVATLLTWDKDTYIEMLEQNLNQHGIFVEEVSGGAIRVYPGFAGNVPSWH